MNTPPLNTLDSVRQRRTLKVIAEQPLPAKSFDEDFIHTLIESAYYAPQHYPCSPNHQSNMASPLPWRFYVLSASTCRTLAAKLIEHDIAAGKIIGMLNSADYLIQATWCPLPSNNQAELFSGNLVNMEHIAAAGAAIQNLLLTATALGHENYWSSGGVLRNAPVSEWLGISNAEILLGSLFIFPNEKIRSQHSDKLTAIPSKRRESRGNISDSYRIVTVSR